MFDPRLCESLTSCFYTLEGSSAGSIKKFKNCLTSQIITKKIDLPRRHKPTYYLFKDGQLMNKREKKVFSINYKIESWFLKQLKQKYQVLSQKIKMFFSDLLKVQNLDSFIKDLDLGDLEGLLLESVKKYKDRKKVKTPVPVFQFLSKDLDSVEVLNRICELSPLVKKNFKYCVVKPTPEVLEKISEILHEYTLNSKNSEYVLWT